MVIRLAQMPKGIKHGEEPVKRGNKFGARRTPCAQGHVHASKVEAKRCDYLHLRMRAGEIRELEQQPKFTFVGPDGRQVTDAGRPVRYTADFRYQERDKSGEWPVIVEDVKGRYRDDTWRLRRAFFRHFHPDVDLREVG